MDTNQDRADDPVGDRLAIQPIDPSIWPPKQRPIVVPSALDDDDWDRLRGGSYPPGRLGEQAWTGSGRPAALNAATDRPALTSGDPVTTSPGSDGPAGGHRSRRPGLVVVAALGVVLLLLAILGRSRRGATDDTGASTSVGTGVGTTAPSVATVSTTVAGTSPASPATTVAPGTVPTTASAGATVATTAGPPVLPPALASSPAGRELLRGRPLPWWGEVVDGRIIVRGRIASSSAKTAALANAVKKVGADHVIDELVVDPSVPATDGPTPLFVDTPIAFARGSTTIPATFVTLVGFARYTLFTQPGTRLAVVGAAAADETSTVAIDRAQAVADAVADKVIDPKRITVVTRSATPGATDATVDRRVELVFFGAFDAAS